MNNCCCGSNRCIPQYTCGYWDFFNYENIRNQTMYTTNIKSTYNSLYLKIKCNIPYIVKYDRPKIFDDVLPIYGNYYPIYETCSNELLTSSPSDYSSVVYQLGYWYGAWWWFAGIDLSGMDERYRPYQYFYWYYIDQAPTSIVRKTFLLNPGIYKISYQNMTNVKFMKNTLCRGYQYDVYCGQRIVKKYTNNVINVGIFSYNPRYSEIIDGPKVRYREQRADVLDPRLCSKPIYPRQSSINDNNSATQYSWYYPDARHSGPRMPLQDGTWKQGEALVEVKRFGAYCLMGNPAFPFQISQTVDKKNFIRSMITGIEQGATSESGLSISGDDIDVNCRDNDFCFITTSYWEKEHYCGNDITLAGA